MTHQDDLDNHANQLNPNHDEYRGPEPAGHDDDGRDDDFGDPSPDLGSPEREKVNAKARRPTELEREVLLHLAKHGARRIGFEAVEAITEPGIQGTFASAGHDAVRDALSYLERSDLVFRRTQYIQGFIEPQHVFALTTLGQAQALEFQKT